MTTFLLLLSLLLLLLFLSLLLLLVLLFLLLLLISMFRYFSDVVEFGRVEGGDDHVVVGGRVLDVTNRFQNVSLE
jgi:hypothetical protein